MVPVSAAFLVVPGLTGGGFGDDALRAARHFDEASLVRQGDDCLFNSFTAGTPVQTENGLVPIEEIRVGDKVLAQDPETGETGYFEVVDLTHHPTDDILRITIDDDGHDALAPEVMEITPGHPVYVEGKGWVDAEKLVVGDRLRRTDGGWAEVREVERVVLATPKLVYNFTVKGMHTYFVLEVGVLVHNVDCLPTSANGYLGAAEGFPNTPRLGDPVFYPSTPKRGQDLTELLDKAATDPSLTTNKEYIYAIEKSGNIRVGNHHDIVHSQLVNGANVYGAGEIHFGAAGQIIEINAHSGHYSGILRRIQALQQGKTIPKFGPQFRDYLEKLLREEYNLQTSPDLFNHPSFHN
jgi:hypothetical protein